MSEKMQHRRRFKLTTLQAKQTTILYAHTYYASAFTCNKV